MTPAAGDEVAPAFDLTRPRRIHVVNVGGAGMSGVATVLAQMGHHVSGVDHNETPFLPALRDLGVDVSIGGGGHAPTSLDAVVVSTATSPEHPDVVAAAGAGVPVLHRSDALEAICAPRDVLAISGTHGKSTVTAMAATIHDRAQDGSGYLVGTCVPGLGGSADWRRGPGFVIEADESDGTFLRLRAHDVIVTNVEADHLSFWGTETALAAAFERFVATASGHAILCLDDPGARDLVKVANQLITYGTDPAADLRIGGVSAAGFGVAFHVDWRGTRVDVTVPSAPGIHNARNAGAAMAAALVRGVPLDVCVGALASFAGVARRFEVRGEAGGVTFVDSYDHLPTEIEAVLAAAASGPFDRVVCVFQPHRFTRTRDLAPAFSHCFAEADVVAITDLYSAGEAPIPGVSSRLVHDAVASSGHPDLHDTGNLDETTAWLLATLRPGDCCLTLNAGDLTTVPDRLIAAMRTS